MTCELRIFSGIGLPEKPLKKKRAKYVLPHGWLGKDTNSVRVMEIFCFQKTLLFFQVYSKISQVLRIKIIYKYVFALSNVITYYNFYNICTRFFDVFFINKNKY